MKHIEKIKEMLCTELEIFGKKNALTVTDLEKIHKLTDTIKNLDKIEMLEEDTESGYSERGGKGRSYYGMSYDDDMMYSERRGRGRNAKRDSMGRYSSDDGSSYDHYDGDMAYAKGSKNYSRDDAKDHMMSMLGGMMEDADPNERQILKDAMRKLERA